MSQPKNADVGLLGLNEALEELMKIHVRSHEDIEKFLGFQSKRIWMFRWVRPNPCVADPEFPRWSVILRTPWFAISLHEKDNWMLR